MTNREMIEMRVPYPASEMAIKNSIPTDNGEWLDNECTLPYAYETLIRGFNWGDSPEGWTFWGNIYEKLKSKNI